jgi:hypothetical protein
MTKCYFHECPNDAEKVVSRPTTEEERNMRKEDGRLVWEFRLKISVCNDHLEEALKEYPDILNEEPS